jgi:hypothetical protein
MSLVGAFVEPVSPDAIGLVVDDRSGPSLFDLGAEGIAIIALIGNDGLGWWSECQNIACGSDVGFLARGQVERDGSAQWITECMDFCGATAARMTDRLRVLPLFRQRRSGEL